MPKNKNNASKTYDFVAFSWISREANRRATQLRVGLYIFQYESSVLERFGEKEEAFCLGIFHAQPTIKQYTQIMQTHMADNTT